MKPVSEQRKTLTKCVLSTGYKYDTLYRITKIMLRNFMLCQKIKVISQILVE